MDYIVISDLMVFANHGVFQEEKKLGQKFYLDLKLGLDLQDAGIHNNLDRSVHYGLLSKEISDFFASQSHDLIETCAEEIAQKILSQYDFVEEVNIRIKKPWAPIGLSVETVLVDITRKKHRVFLGLGSNMGDSAATLEAAIEKIKDPYVKIQKTSSLYQTKAWGMIYQPDFLNQVLEIRTTYQPMQLLKHLQAIESELGRVRKVRWGPRTIDIDILFFDDMKLYRDNLIVPHPYVEERMFVLEPMNEIAPHFIHPVQNKSIRILLQELKEREK